MAVVSMSYAEMNPKSADEITYDNTTSGLEADNVQDAVDELTDLNVIKPGDRFYWCDYSGTHSSQALGGLWGYTIENGSGYLFRIFVTLPKSRSSEVTSATIHGKCYMNFIMPGSTVAFIFDASEWTVTPSAIGFSLINTVMPSPISGSPAPTSKALGVIGGKPASSQPADFTDVYIEFH